jgi:ATP-dependent DNA helicase
VTCDFYFIGLNVTFWWVQLQQKQRPFSVLLTTYELVMGKFDTLRFSKIKWEYIIVDEGHRLKNVDCKLVKELKKFKSRHRLLLTGNHLENVSLHTYS